MRSVSYVQRVALEFSGSLFPHAICLGDVDNDTMEMGVVSWWWATQTVWCELSAGRS
ncbi:ITFG2 isoform 10 [Pan troglodytes]|uniref:Integrin alpha FG-GAP repeat containing 2 n=10 Tax=Simiiformes TaxID=314293 RepID=F5H1D0_HUMAN|nr:integrin alpha FG-GAP repeat containing 2 isoform 4 [Homo sapiens]KAI2563797.1 integrin alpha FG-GAP repeat containing 2 [Homo sapiens]KAI4064062.1 integrin alpha FG-GAP repeat containing 2 [Homo sapiens]PNI36145.1 ITFG2 isoform 10 [Pan troglodytes]PNJ15301.1 ITFG2 isoform 10 [Pongo abelii]